MTADQTTLDEKEASRIVPLSDYPLFRGLSGRHLEILSECSRRATFNPGETVVETGEPTDCIYVVVSGSIGVETPGEHDPARVRKIGPGGVLGWSWLFPPHYWQFSAVAQELTEAIFFPSSHLCRACDHDREFGLELFKRLSPAIRFLTSSSPPELEAA